MPCRSTSVLLLTASVVCLGLASCSESSSPPPINTKDASPKADGSATDSRSPDASAPDAGPRDSAADRTQLKDAARADVAIDKAKTDAPLSEDAAASEDAEDEAGAPTEAGPSTDATPDVTVDANLVSCSDITSVGRLAVYYFSESPASTASIKLHLDVANHTAEGVRQSRITVRYWFTDPDPTLPNAADRGTSTDAGAGRSAGPPVVTKLIPLDPPRQGANTVLEISFPYDQDGGAGGFIESGAIVLNLHKDSGTDASSAMFDQTQNYSYDPKLVSKFDPDHPNPKITAYIDGKLAWGCEPQ